MSFDREVELRKKISKLDDEIHEIESRGFLMDDERENLGSLYERMDKLQQQLDKLQGDDAEWDPKEEGYQGGGPKDIDNADWWKNGGNAPGEAA